jgi:glycine cleavage system H protein
MRFPENLKYTKDHEWAKIDGKEITVGITDHAQSALGDIVFVELPKIGREVKAGETLGVVESIKAVSDLYAPASGKVIAVNDSVVAEPSLLNREPQTTAWLVKLELPDGDAANTLMDAAEYSAYVETLK